VHVRDAHGESELEVNVLISAVGMLNRPAVPDIEGLDTFAGPCFHSSHWDHAVDLHDERVAVVGTGASAMQFVPAIAPDADVIVLGTGFHPNKYLWPMEIVGRGHVLHEEWGDDPRAYLGMTMPGFPNLFCLYGPNTNPVVGSVVFVLECQVNYVVKAIGAMLEHGWSTMECRRDVHDAYNERVDAEHEQLVWRHPRVHSYYNNDAGRVTTNMPWKLVDYWRMTREPSLDDFVVTSAERGG
jgi:cation diffusion facilitator CzcD-associated flavoprotein CzcO